MNPIANIKEIPYWLDPPPLARAFPCGDLPARTDVLVIGSGYTGVAAAIRLRQAGLQVTLIDRQKLATYLGEKLAATVLGSNPVTAFAGLPFRPVPFHNKESWFLPLVYAYFSLMDRIT